MSSALEAALSTIDTAAMDPIIRAKLRGLMRGYDARWADSSMNITSAEETLTSDLFNPATEARSRSFIMAGKLDLRVEENGRFWIVDHKTSSEDINDPNAAYWRQLLVEGQHHHYGLLEHLNGRRIEGAVWDVVKKPGIALREIKKSERTILLEDGTYFGFAASPKDVDAVREHGRETPTLYEYRLATDCIASRPEWYFQRRRIARLDAATLEYAEELWGHTQEMLLCRRTGRWPRNSGACLLYGRACVYLGICSGYDEPDSPHWQRREWVHPELPVIDNGDGRDVLTNSRVRCFQTCRRKHFYSYELGIERVQAEDAEALFFGTAWHAAMETYFESQKEDANDDCRCGEPANEVGSADRAPAKG
jgi:hypothetical protein